MEETPRNVTSRAIALPEKRRVRRMRIFKN